jgi:hypothetical protein
MSSQDPWFLSACIAANESSAVASVRTVNTAEVAYNSAYPTVGFSADLVAWSAPPAALQPRAALA